MEWIKFDSADDLAEKAFALVKQTIKKPNAVIALPTGYSPVPLYQKIVSEVNKGTISFRNVIAFTLDEYVGISKDDPASFYNFIKTNLFNHIDIPPEHIHTPNGNADDLVSECRRYDDLIDRYGPINLAILGVGKNGHIAFNEPGDDWDQKTHIVTLSTSTRKANAKYFIGREVPTKAITMGIRTILSAEKILLLVVGRKRRAVKALMSGKINPKWPVTSLRLHDDVTVIVDKELYECTKS